MKKFWLLFLLFVPVRVFANPLNLTCPDKVYVDSTFVCVLKGLSDYSSIDATLDFNNVSYYGEKTKNNYSSRSSEDTLKYLSYYKTSEGLQDTEIVSLEFLSKGKAGDNISINLKNFTVVLDKTKINQGDIHKTIKIEEVPTTTKVNKKTYTASFDGNGGKLSKSSDTCDALGTQCSIDVSSIVGTRSGYVFKGFDSSSDCENISDNTLRLKKDTTYYACWEKSDNQEISTTTTTKKSTNNVLYLDTLVLDGIDLDFSKFQNNYDLKVLYDVESVSISATSTNVDIKVDYEKETSLAVGINTVIITLTDNDNNKSIYKVNIERLKEGEVIDNPTEHDATLSSLNITGYDISFDSNIKSYDLILNKSVNKLDINPVTSNENAKYIISGNHDLTNGSVVKIIVQASDGTTRTEYVLNIINESFIKRYSFYIICALVLIVIILVIVAIITKEKFAKKKVKKTKKQGNKGQISKKEDKIDVLKL